MNLRALTLPWAVLLMTLCGTSAGAAPVRTLESDFAGLRAAFDRDRGSVRLLLLLSPT